MFASIQTGVGGGVPRGAEHGGCLPLMTAGGTMFSINGARKEAERPTKKRHLACDFYAGVIFISCAGNVQREQPRELI